MLSSHLFFFSRWSNPNPKLGRIRIQTQGTLATKPKVFSLSPFPYHTDKGEDSSQYLPQSTWLAIISIPGTCALFSGPIICPFALNLSSSLYICSPWQHLVDQGKPSSGYVFFPVIRVILSSQIGASVGESCSLRRGPHILGKTACLVLLFGL